MIEGMAESIGMIAVAVSVYLYAQREEILAKLAERREARPAPIVAVAKPVYQGRHRFDETKPWESRVFDEDKKEVGRVRSEGTKARRAGSQNPGPGMRPGTPARAERGDRRTPGQLRAPAGQARQRFARASARSEKLMGLR